MISKIEKLEIPGAYKIILNEHLDSRGSFIKIFNSNIFKENSLNSVWREDYFSISKKHTYFSVLV